AGVNGTLAKYPGSDGQTYAWGHNFSGGSGFCQILDHSIVGGKHYTVIYDAKNLFQSEPNHLVSFFYPDGDGEANHVELESQWYLVTTINDDNWYEIDIEMLWTALPDMPYLGKPLGLKFYFPDQGSSIYTGIDNVRLTSIDASTAWKPQPENEQKEVVKDVTLSWNPGMWAAGHEVDFGTSFTEVDDADRFDLTGIYRGPDDVTGPDPNGRYSYTPDEIPLLVGTTYYWRVDEVNDTYSGPNPPPDGRWKGNVWSFYTTGFALNPDPADGAANVPLTAILTWTAGTDAESHDVYFGTDYDNVTNANTSSSEYRPPRLSLGNESYDAGANENLQLGEKYYWRIDEITDGGTRIIKGDIWTFTVAEFLIIEDMESYGVTSNFIAETWIDGWNNPSSGYVYLQLGSADANLVYGEDGNSMRYNYRNDLNPYYSETTRSFSPAQDWSIAGFKALVLSFRADFSNDQADIQPMSVSLTDGTDTGTVVYDDPNDLAKGWMGWMEWNMALDDFNDQGIDISKITGMSIIIGDGTQAGDGDVYIDNIRLHTTRCVIDKATGSFTYDCDVDFDDLAALARDWLLSGMGSVSALPPDDTDLVGHWKMDDNAESSVVLDSSGHENYGVLFDDLTGGGSPTEGKTSDHSVAGANDLALEFDGFDDFVEIPALNSSSNTITITAWVKREPQGHIYDGIVMSSTGGEQEGSYTAGLQFGAETSDWSPNYELSFMWTGLSWEWHSGLFVPPQEWTFTALTVAPDLATIYMYDGTIMLAARNYDNYLEKPWDAPLHIADQMQYPGRFFPGAIDDVRIYNRTLSPDEIVYLAQGAGTSAEFTLESWRANANPTGPGNDDIVNYRDFAIMADNWLTEVLWP
ncbi:MAG: LamG domain-containing protein, partial [Sedimentisphaerales bacterium]|nr:LamG domain-containing protein [Sedimentisphaerales bacterium]